jgi:ribosomal protein S18 acetylase RimI-like enzyme
MLGDVAALEEASYATWTADESDVVGGWHVTATAGLSRRVNSARDLGDAVVDNETLLALTEWFDERELTLVVRETPIMTPTTSSAVRDQWGFEILDETPVMVRNAALDNSEGVAVVRADDSVFQEELYALNGRTDGDAATLRRICRRVAHRGAGLWMAGVGAAVVVQNGRRCAVFSLAVEDAHRREGIGTRLMAAASTWAVSRGASEIFVQVAGTNGPAIALYGSLGYQEVYRYRYLQPEVGADEGGQ